MIRKQYAEHFLVLIAVMSFFIGGCKQQIIGPQAQVQASAPKIGKSPLIAFWSTKDGNPEIYSMRIDGSDVTRLTHNEKAEDSYPVFSPDGSKIVFESNRTGNFEIYVMNADGTDHKRLTDTPEDEVSSSWSPDGSKIVFVSFRDGETSEIYEMNADGSNEKRLTHNDFDDEAPHFSPDGKYIATESGKERDRRQIYVMNADGSDHHPITQMESYQGYPTWSADGSKIYFDSTFDGGGLYSVNPDGTNLSKLAEPLMGTFISQAPDGSQLLFVGAQKGEEEFGLYVMDNDGKNWKTIKNVDFDVIAPTWNPASFNNVKTDWKKIQKIAFHSNRDGNTEIYSIHANGTNEKRLTNNDAYDGFPSWSPDGSQILFQSGRDGEQYIYVMDSNGDNARKIPNTQGGNYAKWSRDGSKIAFFAERDGNTEIMVVNSDGSHPINLTKNSATDETPSWTRDGQKIAFQTNRGGKPGIDEDGEPTRANYGIYSMDADGGNQTEITGFETNDENPSISPDGKQVVYQSYINDGLAIVVVNTDGTDKRILTDAVPPNGSPAWSGDGKKIAFDSMRDGNFEIFTMNIDGAEQKQLTFTEGEEVENSGASWTQY